MQITVKMVNVFDGHPKVDLLNEGTDLVRSLERFRSFEANPFGIRKIPAIEQLQKLWVGPLQSAPVTRLPEKWPLGRAGWYATVTLLCGKEAENLAHNALALFRLEEVLRMGGAVKDNQLFRFGGFFIIRTNLWQPRSVAAGVIARYNE
jgi:hypothetical protein